MADIPPAPAPSDAELTVLKCFWRDGDLSAREVHTRVAGDLDWTPSTTRTVLERMRAKGLLDRRDVHGLAVYATAQSKVAVIGRLMKRLGAVLDLDGPLPAAAFSGSQLLSEAEIAELAAVLKAGASEEDQ